ncbi:uncharacterized protein LOC135487832 [Lineus longissimus]|uniref:uncharacterized protein LOC135487832 n=1 Tax=Lineus longissimus TaxID=88925 RepID=UPI002B4E4C6A
MAKRAYETFGVKDTSLSNEKDKLLDSKGDALSGSLKTAQGLTIWTAVMFVVGDIAGTGILALPKAIVDCGGPLGIVMLFSMCTVAAYTGVTLGWSWEMLEDRYEEYRLLHVQDPFAAIGYRAMGNFGRYLVRVANYMSIFGCGVIFLLLSAEMVEGLLSVPLPNITFCVWMLVVAAILVPISWLGTPKDMWPVAIGATMSSGIACILIFANLVILIPETVPNIKHSPIKVEGVFMAFGTITFAFCGHTVFPTIQHDMLDRSKFANVIILGYVGMMTMFAPMVISAFYILGDLTSDNVLVTIEAIDKSWITYTVQVLFLFHLLSAFNIVLNPLWQGLEHICHFKNEFGIKRIILRTLMIGVVLFVAESVPRFGPIMSLVGGTCLNLMVFILPPIFYELLCRGDGEFPKVNIPLHMHVIHIEIIVVGIIAGAASCYSAINEIVAPGTFIPPCYLNATAAKEL